MKILTRMWGHYRIGPPGRRGTTIWKKDLEELDFTQTFNKMFPHTDVIFFGKKERYVYY